MFWHFLKVVYSRACESRGVWIKVRKLKISITCKYGFSMLKLLYLVGACLKILPRFSDALYGYFEI